MPPIQRGSDDCMIPFNEFFSAATGFEPFSWQSRLALQVIESDANSPAWPDILALPTSSGKTGTLHIALYALAARKDAHRRICYVVDRRVVVDSGYQAMLQLRDRVRSHSYSALAVWAAAVRRNCSLPEGSDPFEAVMLRGGLGEPLARLKSPVTPTVMCSTIDQLGSRLLFRGYGSSPRSWPIAAGLLAQDTLWLLDEAHISTPFAETLSRVQAITATSPICKPMRVVELSATPRPSAKTVFTLGVPDERLRPRLEASKPTTFIGVSTEKELVTEIVAAAKREISGGRRRIGIIVNRIRTARQVFNSLEKTAKLSSVLLIGPIRGHERKALYASPVVSALFANAKRPETPTVAICTQTVEVGADLDFESLIVQSAPIDVLEQRFGRLDRLGTVSLLGHGAARGTIVHLASEKVDPVYAEPLKAIAQYLQELDTLDFGVGALAQHRSAITPEMSSIIQHAEPLVIPHVERLAQTVEAPYDTPDTSAFLHGHASDPDVALCWREALREGQESEWKAQVEAALPCQGEVLSVPLYAARAWLTGTIVEQADVSIPPPPADEVRRDRPNERRAVILRAGSRQGEVRDHHFLRAGDTVVIPASYGGCDRYGWDPTGKDDVTDLSEIAYYKVGRRARLKINVTLLDQDDPDEVCRLELAGVDGEGRRAIAQELIRHLDDAAATSVNGSTWLSWRARLLEDDRVPDATSILHREITLADHSAHVRDRAREFALACGINEFATILETAGWLHDIGKADLVMQQMLCRGVVADQVLAKGKRGRLTSEQRLLQLPKGYRHEAISVSMIDDDGGLDRDLLKHLVGAHHGYGRPWFPPADDHGARPVEVELDGKIFSGTSAPTLGRLDSGWLDQFTRLNRRYGYWGLAYLEAILRLADHRCSQDEEEGTL